MSASLFLQFIRQVHADPAVPGYIGTLPPSEVLHSKAWQSSFVFTYEGAAAAGHVKGSSPPLAATTLDAFLHHVLAADWPTRGPAGLPLLEVSTCVIAREEVDSTQRGSEDAGGRTGEDGKDRRERQSGTIRKESRSLAREYLVATRYELASTVFAIERFTVLSVPAAAGGGGALADSVSPGMREYAASVPTVLGSQEMSVALEEQQDLRALRAAAHPHGNGSSESKLPSPPPPGGPAALAAELAECSFLQRQRTRAVLTVCRVITTAGGSVPDSATAVRHLLNVAGAASPSAAVASSRGLATRFHAFLHSNIPFLGADEQRRQAAWDHVQQLRDRSGRGDAESANAFAMRSSSADGDDKAKQSNMNTTLASNTSAMSEQGQTPGEGSRQPSHPQTHGSGGGSEKQPLGRGIASVNSSLTSCGDVAVPGKNHANQNGPGSDGYGVQVRWGSSRSHSGREGSTGSAGGSGGGDAVGGVLPYGAAGPVGVTPLPSLAAARPAPAAAAAAPTTTGGKRGAHECRGSAAETDEDVFAQIYSACGPYFTPAAMAQRRSHLHWQLDAVESVFIACPPYSHRTTSQFGSRAAAGSSSSKRSAGGEEAFSVTEGWQRWATACSGGLSRPLIINSMDDIVAYCENSRQAFFAAVAMLDYFVVRTADDPRATCVAFMNCVRASRFPQQQQYHGGGSGKEKVAFGPGCPGFLTEATDKDISSFFTQVICVCCMLGCKIKDTYPPLLKKLLACLNSNSGDGGEAFTEVEFTLMEVFLLQRVFGFAHLSECATVNEVVDLLLFLMGGDAVKELAEFNFYARLLKRRGAENEWMNTQVATRIAKAERGLRCARQDYLESVEYTAAAEAAQEQQQRHRRAAVLRRHTSRSNEEEEDGEGEVAETVDAAATWHAGQASSGACQPPPIRKEEVREWHRLSLLARFLCDLAVRGPRNTTEDVNAAVGDELARRRQQQQQQPHSEHELSRLRAECERQLTVRLQCGALEVSPCALAVAVVAVTAEVLRVSLPTPLYAILPADYKASLAESGLAPETCPAKQRDGAEGNEESLLGAPAASQPPPTTRSIASASSPTDKDSDAHHPDYRRGGCFPLRPHDDLYLVLAHFCALFCRNEQRERQEAANDGTSGNSRSGSLDLTRALTEVHKIYQESREGGPCDAILRRRYKDMLSM